MSRELGERRPVEGVQYLVDLDALAMEPGVAGIDDGEGGARVACMDGAHHLQRWLPAVPGDQTPGHPECFSMSVGVAAIACRATVGRGKEPDRFVGPNQGWADPDHAAQVHWPQPPR